MCKQAGGFISELSTSILCLSWLPLQELPQVYLATANPGPTLCRSIGSPSQGEGGVMGRGSL